MNKKVLGMTLVLFSIVIMTAPLIGSVEACGYKGRSRRPEIATVDYCIQVWPAQTQPEDFEIITGDNIVMGYKDAATFGNPPLVETIPPTIANYGNGGFKLAITVDGQDYELFATVQKKILLFVIYTDGAIEISKWCFTIVESTYATALDAVGDKLEGWLIMRNGKTIVTSTAGTGIFKGARLIGDLTTTAHPITPAVIFTVAVGSGHIVFPRGFP